jgi:RNA polymerase subunit RPABC4/transcription elongation factor Spt4
MQCVRCGKVLNQEDKRCPKCFASLSNQQISQMEVAQQQLKEIADIERSGMNTRYAKQGTSTGALVGGLGLVVSLNPLLMLAGAVAGGAVGWFIAWRGWGVFRASLLFSLVMMPIAMTAGFNPFTVLAVACTGMVIGWSVVLLRH